MRESLRRRNNMIIGGLLLVVAMMTVAYAVLQTQLNIGTTTTINNNWNVEITNIEAKDIVNATDNASSYEALSATFDASLESPGSEITYEVTVTNNGSIDAYLNEINKNIESNSDLIEVEFSGFTKGQMLYASTSEIITVKITFDPNYKGNLTENISTGITIDLLFNQQGNSDSKGENPLTKYLVTYDSGENGGVATNDNDEYLAEGETVDLSKTASKEGYDFVGWNTNKTATSGIDSLTIEDENVTLYAIYKKDININYTKDERIISIGKETDTCSMYNNDENCEITLPEITISEDTDTYDANWYLDNTIAGKPNKTYKVNQNVSLNAKPRLTPYMKSGNISINTFGYKETGLYTNVLKIVDIDKTPIPNDISNDNKWDLSEKGNGSVMAWFSENIFYIGGSGGVIAPEDSSYLFSGRYSAYRNFLGSGGGYNRIDNLNLLDTSRVTNMSHMFEEAKVGDLDLNNWDTSNVTDMSYMFERSGILNIYLSNFNMSKVTNVNAMFDLCTTPTDISNLDTSNMTNMSGMFYGTFGVDLDLSSWDTSNVTDMSRMFEQCGYTSLDLSSFDTSSVTNMSYMFNHIQHLTSLDLSSFDTSKVTNMGSMFYDCANLKTIYASDKFVTTQVSDSSGMFSLCTSLVGGAATVYSSSHRDAEYARIDAIDTPGYFTDKTKPKIERISTNTAASSITAVVVASDEFSEITKYEFSMDGNTWYDTGTNTEYIFNNLEEDTPHIVYVRVTNKNNSITQYKTSTIRTTDITLPTFVETRTETGKTITITYPSECTDGTYTCTYSKNDSDNVTISTTTVDVPFTESGTLVAKIPYGTNTNQVISSSYTITMNSMLRGNTTSSIFATSDNINSDVTKSKITTVEVVDNLNAISSIEEGYKWDVSSEGNGSVMAWVVKDEENSTDSTNYYHLYIGSDGNVVANPISTSLFNGFSSLTTANLTKLDTTNVTNMTSMFQGCSSLNNLNISNWNTANVTRMTQMFRNCTNLETLDLSSFKTSEVSDSKLMFYGCTNLKTIYVSDKFTTKSLKTSGASSSMFQNCTSLVGGNRTTYSSSHRDAEYARIDKEGQPGYFTDISQKQS